MANLEQPIELEDERNRTFKFVDKDQTTLYTFSGNHVTAVYNVLLNFVGNLLDTGANMAMT